MARRVNLTDALSSDNDAPTETTPAPAPKQPKKRAQNRAKKSPAPKPAPEPADPPKEKYRRTEPNVRGVSVSEAKRVSLYLHPDDYDWLRYELRGGDIQAVMRSMIAVCRNNQRLAEQVARLSRTAPRGKF